MLQSLKLSSAQTQNSSKSEAIGENWNMVKPQSELEELTVIGIPVIPGLERLRQLDRRWLEANLSCTVKP